MKLRLGGHELPQRDEEHYPGSNTSGPSRGPLLLRSLDDANSYFTKSILDQEPEAAAGGGGQNAAGVPGKEDDIESNPSNWLRPFTNKSLPADRYTLDFNTGFDSEYTQRQYGKGFTRQLRLSNEEMGQRACAWCRHDILPDGNKGRELTPEEYSSVISHGVCRECAEIQLAEFRASRVSSRLSLRGATPDDYQDEGNARYLQRLLSHPSTSEVVLWKIAEAYPDNLGFLSLILAHPNFQTSPHFQEVLGWVDNLERGIVRDFTENSVSPNPEEQEFEVIGGEGPQEPWMEAHQKVMNDAKSREFPPPSDDVREQTKESPIFSPEDASFLENHSSDEIWQLAVEGDPTARDLINRGLVASVGKRYLFGNVLDRVRDELDPAIWTTRLNGLPMIIPAIKMELVERFFRYLYQFGEYSNPERWVKNMFYTGSTATRRYNPSSDIDIHVVVDWKDMVRYNPHKKKSLPEMWQEMHDTFWWTLNTKSLPGTKHPVQYYVIRPGDEPKLLTQKEELYDMGHDVWLVPPVDVTLSEEAVAQAQAQATRIMGIIDQHIANARKGLIDFALLSEDVNPGNAKVLHTELLQKVQEIDNSLIQLKGQYRQLKKNRADAFLTPSDQSRNATPGNIVFKLIERYKYLDVLRNLERATKNMELDPSQLPEIADILGLHDIFKDEYGGNS